MSDRVLISLVIVACLVLVMSGWMLIGRHILAFGPRISLPIPSSSARVAAGKAIPCGPKSMLMTDLQAPYADFFRKWTVVAYREHGKHDPRWDATAEKFLDAFALRTAGTLDAPDVQPMIVMADDLTAKHCDDPLILERIGKLKLDLKQFAEADRLVRAGIEGMKGRGFPVMCLANAYQEMATLTGEVGADVKTKDFKWRPLALKAFAEAADKSNFGPYQQRIMWVVFGDLMSNWFPSSRDEFVKALEDRPNSDTWLLNMARGKIHHDYAWARRGHDWANNVSEADMRAFEEASDEARKCFEKAYQAHPEYPESSWALLTIANCARLDAGGSVRDWFDRGVAAQFDYLPIYQVMATALLPRWGGSHEEMLAFGEECLNTRRFDTDVPGMYGAMVQMIANVDHDESIYRYPGVWPNLQRMFNGMLDYVVKNKPERLKDLRTAWADMAARAGHPDEAQRQWAAMKGGGR
jgi:tetratricopeptide (TPR) repeat protein